MKNITSEIKFMDFEDIVKERYATKLFDGRKVPEEKLNRLLEIIRHAPSSFNIQPWSIIVVENQALKEKLAPASWNQPQIMSCSHLLVFCANKNIAGNIDKLEKFMIKAGAKPESIKSSFGIMRNFEENLGDEEKIAWAQRQMFLALGNAVNGAKALGFDSCPMEGFDPKTYGKILKLPEYLIPTVLCPIGYASDEPRPKIRFPQEEIIIFQNGL